MKKEEMLDEVLKSWEVPMKQTKAEAWEMLQARINEKKVVPMYKRPMVWTAAAAACIIAFGVMMFQTNDVVILAAVSQEVVLPDGSTVQLDKGAELSYDPEWEVRELTLKGEAFFNVEKGAKFTVNTDKGNVSVLGTSFNVYAEHDHFQVECFTGRVKVVAGNQEEVITKGLGVKLRNNELTSPYAHNIEKTELVGGVFQYTQADLVRVIEDIEAHFGVVVNIEGAISGEEFSGQFEVSDAQSALGLVAKAMGMNLNTTGTGVYTLTQN